MRHARRRVSIAWSDREQAATMRDTRTSRAPAASPRAMRPSRSLCRPLTFNERRFRRSAIDSTRHALRHHAVGQRASLRRVPKTRRRSHRGDRPATASPDPHGEYPRVVGDRESDVDVQGVRPIARSSKSAPRSSNSTTRSHACETHALISSAHFLPQISAGDRLYRRGD